MVKARGVVQGVSLSAVGTNVTTAGVTTAGVPVMLPVGRVLSVFSGDEVEVELNDALRPALLERRVRLRRMYESVERLYVTEVDAGTPGALRVVTDGTHDVSLGADGVVHTRQSLSKRGTGAGEDISEREGVALPRRVHVWRNLPSLPPEYYYCDLRSADGAPVRMVRTDATPTALRWRARVFLRGAVTGTLATYTEVDMGTLSDDAGVPGLEVDGVRSVAPAAPLSVAAALVELLRVVTGGEAAKFKAWLRDALAAPSSSHGAVLTGCSGSGKSLLLSVLRKAYAVHTAWASLPPARASRLWLSDGVQLVGSGDLPTDYPVSLGRPLSWLAVTNSPAGHGTVFWSTEVLGADVGQVISGARADELLVGLES